MQLTRLTLPFEDPVGKLVTHELSLDSNMKEPSSSSKNITLKAKMKDIPSDFENSKNEEDYDQEHQVLLSRLSHDPEI